MDGFVKKEKNMETNIWSKNFLVTKVECLLLHSLTLTS